MNELIMTSKYELAKQQNIEDMYTKTMTEKTKRSYMQTIKEFFEVQELSDVTVEDMQQVTPELANLYAHKLIEKGLSKATVNKKLSSLQNFYKFLCRRDIGIMTYNPFETNQGAIRFKNASKQYTDKRILTPDEIKTMICLAEKNNTIIGMRDTIVLLMLSTTGMRREELCSINIGDIRTYLGKKIIEITGKGDKRRLVVLSDKLVRLIDAYIKARGLTSKDKSAPLIASHGNRNCGNVDTNTIYRVVKKYARLAGIDESTISPHAFRATYATILRDDLDMPVDDIQELMGHSNRQTTQRYIKSVKVIKDNPANKLNGMFE